MTDRIRLSRPPDINAVKSVKQYRKPQNACFDDDPPRNVLQFHGNLVIFLHAHERVAVGPEMFQKKSPNRYYAAEGLQFVEDITRFGISSCGRHAHSEQSKFERVKPKYKHPGGSLQDGVMHLTMKKIARNFMLEFSVEGF